MIVKTIPSYDKYKTSKAIEFSIEKLRLGNVIFSCMNYAEARRVMKIVSDILYYADIQFKTNITNRTIKVFGNTLIFVTRDSDRIHGHSVFCAVIDDYVKEDYQFLQVLMCRLRERIHLPYYKKDYYPNELLITYRRS